MNGSTRRTGLIAGVGAYALWGLFPLYWPWLKPAGPFEILAHRIVWSFVFVAVVLLILRTPWGWVKSVFERAHLPRYLAMSLLIAVNWGVYILAVNSGHVVEASVGYFINPLVNVVLGMVFFGEHLGRGGRIGALLAFGGVLVLGWGSLPTLWISLLLAGSFGFYGVAKKKTTLPALQGLLVESGFLALPSAGYLVFLGLTGSLQMGHVATTDLLMVMSGPVTVLPLWLFALAATRLPLGVVGVLQYLAPTVQLILGITLFGEKVSPAYWAGLILIWVGSVFYLTSTLRPKIAPS